MDLTTRLSFGENLIIALLGMAVVFAILFILFVVLKVFGAVFSKSTPKKKEEPVKVHPPVVTQPEPAAVPEVISSADETELIAVISAAISASINKSASEIRVVSFRKAKSKQ